LFEGARQDTTESADNPVWFMLKRML